MSTTTKEELCQDINKKIQEINLLIGKIKFLIDIGTADEDTIGTLDYYVRKASKIKLKFSLRQKTSIDEIDENGDGAIEAKEIENVTKSLNNADSIITKGQAAVAGMPVANDFIIPKAASEVELTDTEIQNIIDCLLKYSDPLMDQK